MTPICFNTAKVSSIHPHGFWIACGGEELYLSFLTFPQFEHATIAQICDLQCVSASRLYWPQLDLDVALDTIRHSLVGASQMQDYDD